MMGCCVGMTVGWGSEDLPRGDLAAVCAMADECIHQAGTFSWYLNLHGAAIASGGCGSVFVGVYAFGR